MDFEQENQTEKAKDDLMEEPPDAVIMFDISRVEQYTSVNCEEIIAERQS